MVGIDDYQSLGREGLETQNDPTALEQKIASGGMPESLQALEAPRSAINDQICFATQPMSGKGLVNMLRSNHSKVLEFSSSGSMVLVGRKDDGSKSAYISTSAQYSAEAILGVYEKLGLN